MKITYYALCILALVSCAHSLSSMSLPRLVRAAVAGRSMSTPIDAIVPQPATRDCPICSNAVSQYNFRTLSCEHTACIACLQRTIELALKEKTTRHLWCPHCRHPFTEGDILSIVGDDHERLEVLRAVQTADLLRKDPRTHYCPTPNCPYAFSYDRDGCPANAVLAPFTCPACRQTYCPQCMIPHDPRTGCPSAVGGELLVGAKPCPQCQTPIVREGGCQYIICLNCGHHFCWNCMGPYDHVPHAPCFTEAEVLAGQAARTALERLRRWMRRNEIVGVPLVIVLAGAISFAISAASESALIKTTNFTQKGLATTAEIIFLGCYSTLLYVAEKIFRI